MHASWVWSAFQTWLRSTDCPELDPKGVDCSVVAAVSLEIQFGCHMSLGIPFGLGCCPEGIIHEA